MIESNQAGFSAVELLITLFIAVLFLAMGFQLYGTSIANNVETRSKIELSDTAYYYMRYVAATASSNACNATLNYTDGTGAAAVQTTVVISCPNSAIFPALRLVTATSQRQSVGVSHATYAYQ